MPCIMGCKLTKYHTLHSFPRNARRRAEWCRILGVYPRQSRVFLCNLHIPDCFIMGNKISRFAIPNPPESRQLINSFSTSCDDGITDKIEKDISNFSDDVQLPPVEKENILYREPPEAREKKIETFEIRKGNNNNMIIKGRFIQTDSFLMVSYTPPKKWSLQKQVTLLNEHCKRQLRQIQIINREILKLRTELKKQGKLLPKLRFLQMHNRLLYAQVKMYKLKEKAARKRK